MIVTRTYCTVCGNEQLVKKYEPGETEDDIHSYVEEAVPKLCKKCESSPEGKLLKALFGR